MFLQFERSLQFIDRAQLHQLVVCFLYSLAYVKAKTMIYMEKMQEIKGIVDISNILHIRKIDR